MKIGEEDFFLDLLFYHTKLRCYVVIELKTGKFRPEYAGRLNFYLSAVEMADEYSKPPYNRKLSISDPYGWEALTQKRGKHRGGT